jgi:hypothetical protein
MAAIIQIKDLKCTTRRADTGMTDESESSGATGTPSAVEPSRDGHPSRLNQALAWVGIVAGCLFIVAAIFFSGFFVSWSMGGHHMGPGEMGCCSQMKPGDHMAQGPMMGPGGPKTPSGQMTPGQMMPGMSMGPGGMMGPSPQSPTTSPPSTPRP